MDIFIIDTKYKMGGGLTAAMFPLRKTDLRSLRFAATSAGYGIILTNAWLKIKDIWLIYKDRS